MKKKKFLVKNLSLILGAVIIIIVVSVIYIRQLDATVAKNTYANISELSKHDKMIIETNIQNMWDQLDYIEGKIRSYHTQSLEDVQKILNVEAINGEFDQLYLVADDGKLYSDRYIIYDPQKEGLNGRLDFLPLFHTESAHIITRYSDTMGFDSMRGEKMLYGARIKSFMVDKIKMVALVGMNEITDIQDSMIVDSYAKDGESRGFSSVIDSDGRFIVNINRGIYTNWENSIYQKLEGYQKLSRPVEEIAEKIAKDERFNLECVDDKGVKRQIYFTPFENGLDWYFMVSVEDSVFTEQSQVFLSMSILMLALVITVIITMLMVLMRSRNEVLEANAEARARSEFLSTMSHEIRTPLNGVIGLLHLLERDIDRGEEREIMKGRLAKAHDTAIYLLALVSDILDMSKLQSGKVELVNRVISVEQMIDAVWSMQHDNIQNRGIAFIVEQNISVPWIIGDEVRIKQILLNIIGNSAKFTPSGGTISMKVSQSRDDEKHVSTTFVCSDTGCGMSPAFLEHIWESFSQERNRNAESIKGTGLGMAITKMLVDTMGAEISVESVLNEGTAFTVTFHSEISEERPQILKMSDKMPEEDMGKKPHKILLAEDNDLNAEILTEILEEAGFETVLAENGKVAVDRFRESETGEFDLILMDMQMPVMDGCEAASEIRKLDRADAESVYIFACTANTFQEDRERAVESGMNGFLTKPIDAEALLQKLEETVGGKKAEEKAEK